MSFGDQLHVGSRHQRQPDRGHVHRRERGKTQQPPGQLHERLVLELPRVERRVDGPTRLGQGLRRVAGHRRDPARDE